MGLLSRLFGRARPDHESRGQDIAAHMDSLAGLDGWWSSEALRRRVRDIFFAVQRSWIERDPAIGEPYMTPALMARQRLRIEGLVAQRRIHMIENPLIEDLDFVAVDESPEPRVVARLLLSMVETVVDSGTGAVVAGAARRTITRVEYWVLARHGDAWCLADVEMQDEGGRHLAAPLVSDRYLADSPELLLRERYAREEITLDEFETRMGELLGNDPTY
jgi:predicted lipid-binding transport protein (Tim44 family)